MNPSPEPTVRLPRRAFLLTAVVAGVGALLGEWWGRRVKPGIAHAAPFEIAGAAHLAPGEALSFTVPGTTTNGLLVRLSPGDYVAFDRRCPHLGCPVLWSAERQRIECPCHAGVFDGASGGPRSGPPRESLRRIALQHRNQSIWAHVW